MGSKKYFGLQGHALSRLQTALIVAPSFILFGYNQAGIGGLITEEDWVKTFPEIDTVNATKAVKSQRTTLQGFVVAVFVIGALFGSLSCSYSGDRFGRRNVIFFAAICTLIGEILEASAFGLPQFIVGRVITGLGVGQLSSLVPVWQSETSGAKNRGRHVVLDGLFICLGYVLESWIDLGFFELHHGPATWRVPIAIAAIFSIILSSSIYMFPESPRWLLMVNRGDQARDSLAVLRGLPQDSEEVQAEIAGIEHSLEITAAGGAKLSHLLKMGEDKLAYRFGLCILLQFYQQMSGSNLISVYAPILFQENLGLSSEMSRVLSAGALTWKFLSSFLAFVAIDRFGRRAVFIVSGVGMSCCMVALAVATSFPTSNRSSQIAAGCFIYLYNMFVPIGFLGANFLYCTEVAPLRLRMAMSSISTANHWAWNFLVAMVTPIAIYSIGWQYYIVFATIAACVPVSVYFLFPETMGRSLEEIDLVFKRSPSAWATVQFEKSHRGINLIAEPEGKGDMEAKHEHVDL
ncbi:general substrate transporter [Annulohypoxylon maeteangense]|uniref:general substrate transporter n=1 Tax=Annulohypoxylon maeteangense TaxID=1927788 RepID=UPI0020074D76|nr:general substrate transporter [Annulohypoxylon maeteangense]KAI0884573.1 general substrate transporter [Annulohypoxylon maeteangense]